MKLNRFFALALSAGLLLGACTKEDAGGLGDYNPVKSVTISIANVAQSTKAPLAGGTTGAVPGDDLACTNASNLKNTYEEVRVWSIEKNTFVPTGQTFFGTIMGDHSKCGINTMFNTGTVIGVSSNIYGHGYQRNYIPSFAWGGTTGLKSYDMEKAIEVAEKMYQRRNVVMSQQDKEILRNVYTQTLKNKRLR